MVKISLDAREMEHPEPLTSAVSILKELEPKQYLYMLNRKNPLPLLELAANQGFITLSKEDDLGIWHILISRDDCRLSEYLDV